MLSKKHGFDVSDYSFDRIGEAFSGMEVQGVRAELSAIRDTVNTISFRMAKVLEQGKAAKTQEVPMIARGSQNARSEQI